MCSDWDLDAPNILKSDSYVFPAKLHNYIIGISKQDLSDSLAGTEAVSWWKFTEVLSRGLNTAVIYFHPKHLS